ncbi:MAG TPA: ABC transporter substrate-binding protein, partial [Stellaceae bacterium]
MPIIHTRRRLITTLASVGVAGLFPVSQVTAAEGVLETTSVRFDKDPSACAAPQYVAEELLRAEGFADIRYVETAPYSSPEVMGHDPLSLAIGRGEVDFVFNFPVLYLPEIEAGVGMTVLAGVHVGCVELFAQRGIRSIGDLKGKSVGLNIAPPHFLTLMAAQVGLDPAKDLHWVTDPALNPLELFAAGKIDAFLGFPPEPQELRAREAGHAIVNTALDRPWSQYYCCMLVGNREYVRNHPVATKR